MVKEGVLSLMNNTAKPYIKLVTVVKTLKHIQKTEIQRGNMRRSRKLLTRHAIILFSNNACFDLISSIKMKIYILTEKYCVDCVIALLCSFKSFFRCVRGKYHFNFVNRFPDRQIIEVRLFKDLLDSYFSIIKTTRTFCTDQFVFVKNI